MKLILTTSLLTLSCVYTHPVVEFDEGSGTIAEPETLKRGDQEAMVFMNVEDLFGQLPADPQSPPKDQRGHEVLEMSQGFDDYADDLGLGLYGDDSDYDDIYSDPNPTREPKKIVSKKEPCSEFDKKSIDYQKCQFDKIELAKYIASDVKIWYGLWNFCIDLFDQDQCRAKFDKLEECHYQGKVYNGETDECREI